MENLKKFRNFFGLTQKQLADILNLREQTVQSYELDKLTPSFKSIIKIINCFQVSLDFFIFFDKCIYLKNLKLLKLAKKLDDFSKSEARNNIEATTKNLLGAKINKQINIKQDDNIKATLINNFNFNLKNMRNLYDFNQEELAEKIGVSRSSIKAYESKNHPPIEKIIKLSEIFNISMHALVTGEKLNFSFNDAYFGTTILLADHFLSLEDHKILIRLMENIVEPEPQSASS